MIYMRGTSYTFAAAAAFGHDALQDLERHSQDKFNFWFVRH